MNDPYEKLAQAIVVQAATDYRKARHKIKTHPKCISAGRDIVECERFFLSGWFTELSGLDGRVVLDRLKQEEC